MPATILCKCGGHYPLIFSNLHSELVARADLERARHALRVVFALGRVHTRSRAPCRIGAVDRIEDIERREIDLEIVAPWHRERLRNARINRGIADDLVGPEHAAEIAVGPA